jgi:hypothetical protein
VAWRQKLSGWRVRDRACGNNGNQLPQGLVWADRFRPRLCQAIPSEAGGIGQSLVQEHRFTDGYDVRNLMGGTASIRYTWLLILMGVPRDEFSPEWLQRIEGKRATDFLFTGSWARGARWRK